MKRFTFVAPEMTAAITGGNLYNLGLTSALRDAGAEVRVIERETALRERTTGITFVDSLYLDDLARLARGAPIHLLAHYLPSLVAGTAPSVEERAALAAADGFVVPSAFMARALTEIADKPVVILAPAIVNANANVNVNVNANANANVNGIVVANLVAGKGVLELLDALERDLPFALGIVGGSEHDPAYAAACRKRAPAGVTFWGPRSHAETLARMAASDLFVSASRMESFGLAIAEARALGVPIVARAGGNVSAHVDERAGGRLFDSVEAVAAECARLARLPTELAGRRRLAQAARLPGRSWSEAAAEFLAAFG